MKIFQIRLLQTLLISTALVSTHGVARAQCTVPPGVAGEQFYNTTHNVMQYCNGSAWVNMGAIGGGGGAGLPGTPIIDQFQAAGVVVDAVTIAATGNKWPDYLICRETGGQQVMIHLQNYSGGYVKYRDGASSFIYIFNTNGTYNDRGHLAANCGAAGADISSICNANRCGFFGGGGGGGGSGLPGGCANDQIAKWNGAAWVCAADDAGGGGGSDTLAGLNCSTNQIAKWNDTAWVCAADETGGGGAGCAGGRVHLQVWTTGAYACDSTLGFHQCRNGTTFNLGGVSGPSCAQACFGAGSRVLLAGGGTKAIEDLQVGDKVVGRGGMTNTVIALKPTTLGDRKLYTINGTLKVTADHPAMTERGWGVLSRALYAQRYHNRSMTVSVEGGQEVTWEAAFIPPEEMVEFGIGDRIAFGDDGFIEITDMTSETLSGDTALYTVALDGDGTFQLEGGYVFLGLSGKPASQSVVLRRETEQTDQ